MMCHSNSGEMAGRVGAIVLAAGFSTRMGEFKPLLEIGGRIALWRLLDSIAAAGISEIIVVTGHRHEMVSASAHDWYHAESSNGGMPRQLRVRTVYNADYKQGMFSSVRAGISALCRAEAVLSEKERSCGSASEFTGSEPAPGFSERGSDSESRIELPQNGSVRSLKAALLFPVDVPMVPAAAIQTVISAWEKSVHSMAVACFNGKKGHPLLIPACNWGEILAHDGSGGLKAIRERHRDRLMMVETGVEGVILDMDTPAEYQEIQRFSEGVVFDLRAESGFTGRVVLVRHGETRRHSGKIFLGQADVPLSREGCGQSVAIAEELKQMGLSVSRIYSSDLSRTMQTAEIIANYFKGRQQVRRISLSQVMQKPGPGGAFHLIQAEGLREICLGEWDGCLMDEIKAKHPEEFKQRGREILCFKPPGGEDFYDMRRRVINTLRVILSVEKSDDVLIVSHAGPIRALVGAFRHLTDEEAWALSVPRGRAIIL